MQGLGHPVVTVETALRRSRGGFRPVISRTPTARPRSLRAAAVVSLSVMAVGSLTACNADGDQALGDPFSDDDTSSATPQTPQVAVDANVTRGKPVPVDRVVELTADQGTLTDVRVRSANDKSRVP